MASFNFPLGVSQNDPNFHRIRQIIAGFRGYETLGDLKAADDQVRNQIAAQLDKAAGEAAGARKAIEAGMHLLVLPDFDRMVEHIHASRDRLQDRYRSRILACHAYQPQRELIRQIYELDFRILTDAENVYNLMQEFVRMAREDMMLSNIYKIDVSLREIAAALEKKGEVIGCMIV